LESRRTFVFKWTGKVEHLALVRLEGHWIWLGGELLATLQTQHFLLELTSKLTSPWRRIFA
jgi:hypothetical protein